MPEKREKSHPKSIAVSISIEISEFVYQRIVERIVDIFCQNVYTFELKWPKKPHSLHEKSNPFDKKTYEKTTMTKVD